MKNLSIEINATPVVEELMYLFKQTTWARERSPERIIQMLQSQDRRVCLRLDGKLIAFGRIITDGCFRGLLDDIVVDQSYRDSGNGSILIKELLSQAENIDELFLNADLNIEAFYEKFGFERFSGLTMKRKNTDKHLDNDHGRS